MVVLFENSYIQEVRSFYKISLFKSIIIIITFVNVQYFYPVRLFAIFSFFSKSFFEIVVDFSIQKR